MNRFSIGLFWVNDERDLEKCRDDLDLSLCLLRDYSNNFNEYYLARAPKAGQKEKPISDSKEFLLNVLKDNALSDLEGNNEQPTLGYALTLKNSLDFMNTSFIYFNGATKSNESGNRFVISFSADEQFISNPTVAIELFADLLEIWEPDWGRYTSSDFIDMLKSVTNTQVKAGIYTYIANMDISDSLPIIKTLEHGNVFDLSHEIVDNILTFNSLIK